MDSSVGVIEEEELWLAFQRGEERAFAYLFHTYYNDLYHYALKIGRDEALAKDVLQELFASVWRTRAQLGAVKAIKPYLMKSLRRAVLRALSRQKSLLAKARQSPVPDIIFSPEEVVIRDESSSTRRGIVLQQLNGLSPRQREVIYLRYYDELSYDEIAQVMGLHYQSVMNHLHKALKALRSNQTLKHLVEVTLALCLSLL
ncbi:MAG TPA: sigma-70 family RNA polymerase sigma factor [Cytophagales bacterium]